MTILNRETHLSKVFTPEKYHGQESSRLNNVFEGGRLSETRGTERQTDRQSNLKKERQTQTNRHKERQTDKVTDIKKDRHKLTYRKTKYLQQIP